MINAPSLLELFVGEIGAQDAQRLHVGKLAIVGGLPLLGLLTGFSSIFSFPFFGL